MSTEQITGRSVPRARLRFSLRMLFAVTFVAALALAGVAYLQVPEIAGWIRTALGGPYTVVVPLVGIVCFVLAGFTVTRGTGPMAAAALLLLCLIAPLIGVLVFLHKGIDSLYFVSQAGVPPKTSEIAEGVANAMSTLLVTLIIAAPTWAMATMGSFIKSQRHKSESRRPE